MVQPWVGFLKANLKANLESPGELMEKRRKTHQHGLQHGEIRCEHTHTHTYIYIYIISEPMT